LDFDECDVEMAVHQKYAKSYGYEFFVARRTDHGVSDRHR